MERYPTDSSQCKSLILSLLKSFILSIYIFSKKILHIERLEVKDRQYLLDPTSDYSLQLAVCGISLYTILNRRYFKKSETHFPRVNFILGKDINVQKSKVEKIV